MFGLIQAMKARLQGQRDGRHGIPKADEAEVHPPELRRIAARGKQAVRQIHARRVKRDRRLKARLMRLRRALAEAARRRGQAEGQVKVVEEEIVRVKGDIAKERAQRKEEGRGGIEREGRLGLLTYLVLLAGGALLELPINALAFSVIGDTDQGVRVFALGVGALLMAAAHVLGIYLNRPTPRTVLERAFICLCLAAAAVVIIGAVVARRAFLLDTGSGSGPLGASLLFTGMNVLLFCLATALACAHHDSGHKMLAHLSRRKQRASRHLNSEARRELGLMERLEAVATARAALFARALSKMDSAVAWHQSVMLGYIASNERARDDGATPPVFKTLPEIEVPEGARVLDTTSDASPNLEALVLPALPAPRDSVARVRSNGHA